MSFNRADSLGGDPCTAEAAGDGGVKILYVRATKEKNLLLLGISEEGESARYTVNEGLYDSIGAPLRGAVIDSESLRIIREYDLEYRAKKQALSFLSLADNSEKNLTVKLIRKGFSREMSARVAAEMVSLGYVDENRQLERLILNEANGKLSGPMKILPKLVGKGYSADSVRAVMRALSESGELDFSVNAKKLLSRLSAENLPRDERRALLYKHGYKML